VSPKVKNRSEILFLYDVTDGNPNGDPLDENKPRIDEETGINYVSDVRLKRTVRDYLYDYKGQEVFIVELRDDNGHLKTKEDRLNDFMDNADLLAKCIDVRLFGATTAVKKKTMVLTGPVQFKFGRSLHRVALTYFKGTTVMASKEDKKQGTFTEKYFLPYSLIAFYGIVNENAAARQNIDLQEEDIDLLLEALWNGTKNLMSTSKMGHMPRLLLQVVHKEGNFHIGELDKLVSFVSEKNDEEIRDIQEGKLEMGKMAAVLKENKDKILEIRYKVDNRVILSLDNTPASLPEIFAGLPLRELTFA